MLHCSGHQLQSIYIIDVLLIIAFICPHCETPGGKTPWETQAQSLDSLKVPILSITHLAGFYPIIELQEVMYVQISDLGSMVLGGDKHGLFISTS